MNGLLNGNRISDLATYINWSLTKGGFDERETRQILKWLLEDLLQKPHVELILDQHQTVSESEILRLHFKLKRILAKEPIQYVLGFAWFMGKRFEVSPAVLIPRPETEELVDKVLRRIQHKTSGRLIDFGTGSGCIPIVIKNNMPQWHVSALDLSAEALRVALQNADAHQTQVDFFQDDILELENAKGEVDVIVSNPPYVLMSDQAQMQKQVLDHEPHLALFVPNNDPCLFYRKIVEWSLGQLCSGGLIAFEVHEEHASSVADLLSNAGFQTEVMKDLQDKDRFVFGTR